MSKHPNIILASGSAGRKSMLTAVGIEYTAIPANIDERALIKTHNAQPIISVTEELAQAKAQHIAQSYPDHIVIGSDQTLEFEGRILNKSDSITEATEKLKQLRGKTHELHSAICVVHNKKSVFIHTQSAELKMRDFNDDFLKAYIAADEDALLSCVGGYKIEGQGAHLFSSITGDNFTIMGMPLLPLLGFLQDTYGIHA